MMYARELIFTTFLHNSSTLDFKQKWNVLQVTKNWSACLASFILLSLEQVVQAILEEYDKDGDGGLSYEEFQPLLSSVDIEARFTIRL